MAANTPTLDDPRNANGQFVTGHRETPLGHTRAQTHGLETLDRRGPTPEQVERMESFVRQCAEDQGGDAELSILTRRHIGHLAFLDLQIELVGRHLAEVGPLTSRGRQRSCVTTLAKLITTYNQVAKTIGLERRSKRVMPTIQDILDAPDEDEDDPIDVERIPPPRPTHVPSIEDVLNGPDPEDA